MSTSKIVFLLGSTWPPVCVFVCVQSNWADSDRNLIVIDIFCDWKTISIHVKINCLESITLDLMARYTPIWFVSIGGWLFVFTLPCVHRKSFSFSSFRILCACVFRATLKICLFNSSQRNKWWHKLNPIEIYIYMYFVRVETKAHDIKQCISVWPKMKKDIDWHAKNVRVNILRSTFTVRKTKS